MRKISLKFHQLFCRTHTYLLNRLKFVCYIKNSSCRTPPKFTGAKYACASRWLLLIVKLTPFTLPDDEGSRNVAERDQSHDKLYDVKSTTFATIEKRTLFSKGLITDLHFWRAKSRLIKIDTIRILKRNDMNRLLETGSQTLNIRKQGYEF